MTCMTFPDIIGLVGVLLILIVYFLLQIERITAHSIAYSLYNAIGALMIIYSLIYKWNLSSFAMEGTWFLLSLYGLYRALATRSKDGS